MLYIRNVNQLHGIIILFHFLVVSNISSSRSSQQLAIESVTDKEPLNYAECFCFCAYMNFCPEREWDGYSIHFFTAGFSTSILYSAYVDLNKMEL